MIKSKNQGEKGCKYIIVTVFLCLCLLLGIDFGSDFICGFPTETDENFNNTLKLVEEAGIDKLHVFPYSVRPGTPAAKMEDQIDEEIKSRRQEELMLIQKEVVEKLNKLKISKVYDTIIEGRKGKFFIGRSSEMAPEIDGTIFVKNADNLKNGDIVKVKITEVLEYDLVGEIDDEFSK
mgnify:CR=1 FL=1